MYYLPVNAPVQWLQGHPARLPLTILICRYSWSQLTSDVLLGTDPCWSFGVMIFRDGLYSQDVQRMWDNCERPAALSDRVRLSRNKLMYQFCTIYLLTRNPKRTPDSPPRLYKFNIISYYISYCIITIAPVFTSKETLAACRQGSGDEHHVLLGWVAQGELY